MLPQVLIGTSTLHWLERTHSFRSFWAAPQKVVQQPLLLPLEAFLKILQTAEKNYSRAVDYHAYRLARRSTRYEETVSSSYV